MEETLQLRDHLALIEEVLDVAERVLELLPKRHAGAQAAVDRRRREEEMRVKMLNEKAQEEQ